MWDFWTSCRYFISMPQLKLAYCPWGKAALKCQRFQPCWQSKLLNTYNIKLLFITETAANICWHKLRTGKLIIWPQSMLRHDILKGKPRLAAAAHASGSVLICLLSTFTPLALLLWRGLPEVSQGHAKRRERGLIPSNPLISPTASPLPPPEPFFIALHMARQRRQAAGGRSLPCTRLVCIKWTHVVFVLRSVADTNP